MTIRPLPFRWDMARGVMIPEQRFSALARRQFTDGVVYVLEGFTPASHKERGHYFASIKQAWDNLDDEATARYPTPEHLRKWALVKAGWRQENQTVCDNKEDALRLAAFLRKLDDYAVVVVRENVVSIYIARSQKIGRPEDGLMTEEEWRRSRDDVLAILSGKIGVTSKTLEKEGRRAS